MRRQNSWSSMVACMALTGCVSVYQPATDEGTATIRMIGWAPPHLCLAGKPYLLPPVAGMDNTFVVPAGGSVTILFKLAQYDGSFAHTCTPGVSFHPVAGQTYVMHTTMSAVGRCRTEVVKVNPAARMGVDVEYTAGPPLCRAFW